MRLYLIMGLLICFVVPSCKTIEHRTESTDEKNVHSFKLQEHRQVLLNIINDSLDNKELDTSNLEKLKNLDLNEKTDDYVLDTYRPYLQKIKEDPTAAVNVQKYLNMKVLLGYNPQDNSKQEGYFGKHAGFKDFYTNYDRTIVRMMDDYPDFISTDLKKNFFKQLLNLNANERTELKDVYSSFIRNNYPFLQKSIQAGLSPNNWNRISNLSQFEAGVEVAKNGLNPVPEEYAKKLLKETFPESDFTIIESKSLSAASIGNVYRVTIQENSGTERTVAVKIKRPDIDRDLENEEDKLKKRVKEYLESEKFEDRGQIEKTIDSFFISFKDETNFVQERKNIETFSSQTGTRLEPVKPVKINNMKLSDDVVVMEYIDGFDIAEIEKNIELLDQVMPESKLSRDQKIEHIVKGLIEFNMQSLIWLFGGFKGDFHGDPHSGNFRIRKSNGKIAAIDLGAVGGISFLDKINATNLALAIIDKDSDGIISYIEKTTVKGKLSKTEKDNLKKELEESWTQRYDSSSEETFIKNLDIIFKNKDIQFKPDYARFLRYFEGVSKLASTAENLLGKMENPKKLDQILKNVGLKTIIKNLHRIFLALPAAYMIAFKDFVRTVKQTLSIQSKGLQTVPQKRTNTQLETIPGKKPRSIEEKKFIEPKKPDYKIKL